MQTWELKRRWRARGWPVETGLPGKQGDGSKKQDRKVARAGSAARERAHLVKGVSTLGDDMRLLSGEPEGRAQGLETDGALLLLVRGVVA